MKILEIIGIIILNLGKGIGSFSVAVIICSLSVYMLENKIITLTHKWFEAPFYIGIGVIMYYIIVKLFYSNDKS